MFSGKKRRPIWQPSRLTRLREATNLAWTISWKQTLLAVLFLFLAGFVLAEILNPVVVIDPVSVPQFLERQGFTPEVVAAQVVDKASSIEEAIKTHAPKPMMNIN